MDAELLNRARGLAGERRWRELSELSTQVEGSAAHSTELAYLVADALRRVGNFGRSYELAQAARTAAARNGNGRLSLRTTNLLGMLEFERGELNAAEDAFQLLLELAHEQRDDEFAARASNNLGVIASVRGEPELAMTAYQRALASYQRLQYGRGLAQSHYNLAIVYRDLGLAKDAENHFNLALQHAESSQSEDVIGLAETERALLRIHSGDPALGERMAQNAVDRMSRISDPLGAANAVRALAAAASVRGEHSLALARLQSALDTVEKHPDLLLRAEIQRDRALIFLQMREPIAAVDTLRDAVEGFEALGAVREAQAAQELLDQVNGDPRM